MYVVQVCGVIILPNVRSTMSAASVETFEIAIARNRGHLQRALLLLIKQEYEEFENDIEASYSEWSELLEQTEFTVWELHAGMRDKLEYLQRQMRTKVDAAKKSKYKELHRKGYICVWLLQLNSHHDASPSPGATGKHFEFCCMSG